MHVAEHSLPSKRPFPQACDQRKRLAIFELLFKQNLPQVRAAFLLRIVTPSIPSYLWNEKNLTLLSPLAEGYVEQFDTLLPELTVAEMLLYTAELKCPVTVSFQWQNALLLLKRGLSIKINGIPQYFHCFIASYAQQRCLLLHELGHSLIVISLARYESN